MASNPNIINARFGLQIIGNGGLVLSTRRVLPNHVWILNCKLVTSMCPHSTTSPTQRSHLPAKSLRLWIPIDQQQGTVKRNDQKKSCGCRSFRGFQEIPLVPTYLKGTNPPNASHHQVTIVKTLVNDRTATMKSIVKDPAASMSKVENALTVNDHAVPISNAANTSLVMHRAAVRTSVVRDPIGMMATLVNDLAAPKHNVVKSSFVKHPVATIATHLKIPAALINNALKTPLVKDPAVTMAIVINDQATTSRSLVIAPAAVISKIMNMPLVKRSVTTITAFVKNYASLKTIVDDQAARMTSPVKDPTIIIATLAKDSSRMSKVVRRSLVKDSAALKVVFEWNFAATKSFLMKIVTIRTAKLRIIKLETVTAKIAKLRIAKLRNTRIETVHARKERTPRSVIEVRAVYLNN